MGLLFMNMHVTCTLYACHMQLNLLYIYYFHSAFHHYVSVHQVFHYNGELKKLSVNRENLKEQYHPAFLS